MSHSFTTPSGLAGWVTGSGPALLLLHGGPGMTDYMGSLLPELDGYRSHRSSNGEWHHRLWLDLSTSPHCATTSSPSSTPSAGGRRR